jgi:hypothetical protein
MAQPVQIDFNAIGIGSEIHHEKLMVPANQRSYAWEESHVRTLLQDLSSSIRGDNPTYFLGTIVLTQGQIDRLEVADGQQRLATTTIFIAAIRDYLEGLGQPEKQAANKYTSDFLLDYDEMTGEHTPKLQLNYEDNAFFVNAVLLSSTDPNRGNTAPKAHSHKRLHRAAEIAREHVQNIVSQYSVSERAKQLYLWIKYLRESATVIVIRVPDHINAFTMFETLNDRGLKASQTDILKNFLFNLAKDRLSEVQPRWSSMAGTIEAVGDDDMLLTYIRHYWVMKNGPTQERELAARVKNEVAGRQQAVDIVIAMDEFSSDYTGLLMPLDYPGWVGLDQESRGYIYVITRVLGIEQIRPLLVAIIRKFTPAEAKKALKVLLSWSVRFLIAGTGGGGPLDRNYGQRAKEVMDGTITTAKEIVIKTGGDLIRTDEDFKQAFSLHRVTKNVLARYFLRALELKAGGDNKADLGDVLEDIGTLNLEHVMPLRPSADWNCDEETTQRYGKRLGNLVLLNPSTNVKLGNGSFTAKRTAYAESPMLSTQKVAENLFWGPNEIEKRQADMAEFAVQIWS